MIKSHYYSQDIDPIIYSSLFAELSKERRVSLIAAILDQLNIPLRDQCEIVDRLIELLDL